MWHAMILRHMEPDGPLWDCPAVTRFFKLDPMISSCFFSTTGHSHEEAWDGANCPGGAGPYLVRKKGTQGLAARQTGQPRAVTSAVPVRGHLSPSVTGYGAPPGSSRSAPFSRRPSGRAAQRAPLRSADNRTAVDL